MKKYKVFEEIPKDIDMELIHLPEFTRKLLFYRGVKNKEEAEFFLNTDYEKTHDPYLLKGMDQSVKRVLKAINGNEKIGIFSDYDADGIPGAVAISDFFKKINYENFIVYIPHRNDEGYGLNKEAIKFLKEENVELMITIDCGISDHSNIDFANSLGIDVIVTDHHLPHDTLPNAFSVINPKQEGCDYPEKMLCGSGVIFKLINAILQNEDFKNKFGEKINNGWEKWLLDMVGLATLSDMVPLLGENRIFAKYGLKVLQKTKRPGLLKLYSILKIDQKNLSEDDIGFLVTPRINVASRMGHPKDAFLMLSSQDTVLGQEMASHLHKINDERKGLVASMIKEIKKIIDEREDVLGDVIVIGNPKWKPSLLGLVANSFSDSHNRPVFLWGRENGDGLLKGSCRSVLGVSIVDLMKESKDLFFEYGGHNQAGGFSILQEKIHLLEESLNNSFKKLYSQKKDEEDFFVDKIVSIDDVSWKLWDEIEKFSPFGMDNPKPVFMALDIDIFDVKHFGKEENHLEISFKNSLGKIIKAIGFFKTKESFNPVLEKNKKINIVFNLEKSYFRNFPELRLRIVDIF